MNLKSTFLSFGLISSGWFFRVQLEIGFWIWKHVNKKLFSHVSKFDDFYMSINLSLASFMIIPICK